MDRTIKDKIRNYEDYVDAEGKVKTLKSGNAIIHIFATGDDDYVARAKDITVIVEKRKISVITNKKSMTVNGMIPTFDVTTVILPAVTRYLKESDLSKCYRLTNSALLLFRAKNDCLRQFDRESVEIYVFMTYNSTLFYIYTADIYISQNFFNLVCKIYHKRIYLTYICNFIIYSWILPFLLIMCSRLAV